MLHSTDCTPLSCMHLANRFITCDQTHHALHDRASTEEISLNIEDLKGAQGDPKLTLHQDLVLTRRADDT